MKKTWYRESVVYQIYPRSFCDSNNDGIGDINGIIQKLDYIKDLGVDIIWLSPIYDSPLEDNGYDISNYYAIHPDYGTIEDFKNLLNEVHKRELKLIMDLVINHTSTEHEWFKEAKKSKDNPYHDYYLWKETPNNWTSFFGGSAWEFNQSTNEFYLHLFAKNQADLNWENKNVRDEMKKMLRFWLEMGVDGFRCDVINLLAKTPGLPNGKNRIILVGKEHYMNHPTVHTYLKEIKSEVFNHYDCFTVGECVFITPEIALTYIEEEKELNMLFQFEHMAVDNYFVKWFLRPYKPIRLKKAFTKWQYAINNRGWNTMYLENHDQPRSISRFGDLEFPYELSSMLAALFLLQQGTPFIFQGQEIGMTNAGFSNITQYKDVETHNIYRIGRKIFSHKRMMKKIKYMSRDNARTPMQWDQTAYAGFSTAEPWIEVNPNYKTINVAKSIQNQESLYHFYKKLIRIRKENQTLVYGDYQDLMPKHKTIVLFERKDKNNQFLVLCNYKNKDQKRPKQIDFSNYEIVLSNYSTDASFLRPYEVCLLKQKNHA